ncbi:MAG: histidine kinase [Bacilli bacterium]|nr:histidine kinase [Bacilli bacterium]
MQGNGKYRTIRTVTYVSFFLLICVFPLLAVFFSSYNGYSPSPILTGLASASSIIAASCFFLLTVVESLSLFFDRTASYKTLVLTVLILLMSLSTHDMYGNLTDFIPEMAKHDFVLPLFRILNFVFFAFASFFFFSYLSENYGLAITKEEKWIGLAVLISTLVLNFVLFFFDIHYVGPILVAIACILFGFRAIWIGVQGEKANVNFSCFIFIGICILTVFINESGVIAFSFYQGTFVSSLILTFAFAAYLTIYLNFVITKTKASYKAEADAAKVKELQANVLKNQISPHYIFNALNVVKSLYNVDKEQGDLALELLSKHLRAYTKAADRLMVPLSQELDVIADFVELEGLKYGKPVEVIYDIDSESVEVPYFSLEPLVENALKYSKIADKEDGLLVIRAHEEEDRFVLEVEDNGVGFDPKEVPSSSYGIKNVKDRMEILLNATFIVESKPNEGTKVRIEIPKGRKGEI